MGAAEVVIDEEDNAAVVNAAEFLFRSLDLLVGLLDPAPDRRPQDAEQLAVGRMGLDRQILARIFGEDRLDLLYRLGRSEEHTSELQSLMRISYAVFCLKKKHMHNHIRTVQT